MLKDWPAIPLILERKNVHKKNLVIGSNEQQIEFLRNELSVRAGTQLDVLTLENITDQELYDMDDNVLISMDRDNMSLSLDTKKSIGIWACRPITKRSAAINVIIRYVSSLYNLTLDKKKTEEIGDSVLYRDRYDIQNVIYDVMNKVADNKVYYKKYNIWDRPWSWINPGDDVDRRLEYLQLELSWYINSVKDEWEKAKSTGCSPSKYKWLKSCKFNKQIVVDSLKLLSNWKLGTYNSYQTLLKLGVIWS